MMKKKSTISDVLENIGFQGKEGEIFIKCINVAKEAQQNETIDAEKEFKKIIEEGIGNEVQ